MRAFAILVTLAMASTAGAQTTNTQCRWIGNIWSCDSRADAPGGQAPIDPGAILRSGASVIPDYSEQRDRKRALDLREREMRLREREMALRESRNATVENSMNDSERLTVSAILNVCPKDESSAVPIEQFPEDMRKMVSSLCFAYAAGRKDALEP